MSLVMLSPDGSMKPLLESTASTKAGDEVYGYCLYKSSHTGKYYAFMNSKNGIIEQYEIKNLNSGEIRPELVRTLMVPSQPEGMVADDESGILYVGEENCCIHKFDAEPGNSVVGEIIPQSGNDNPNIIYDIEGLSIYRKKADGGYLIVSIQGANAFGIFTLESPHTYLGNFIVERNRKVDGVVDTDGIESVNYNFGSSFRKGLLVVQDGTNTDGKDTLAQNFKFIDWRKIERGIRISGLE
jgi:3-phytase